MTPRKGTKLHSAPDSFSLQHSSSSEHVPVSLHSQPTCSSQGQPKQALLAWLSCWELLTARAVSFTADHRCSPHGASRWEHNFAKPWWSLVAETQNPHLAWDLNLAPFSILCSEPNQTAARHENQTQPCSGRVRSASSSRLWGGTSSLCVSQWCQCLTC